jgi:hypothetical protein
MQSGPERRHIGAEWRHDGCKGVEGFRQFGRRIRLGEAQPGRKDEHSLVERRMSETEVETSRGDIFVARSTSSDAHRTQIEHASRPHRGRTQHCQNSLDFRLQEPSKHSLRRLAPQDRSALLEWDGLNYLIDACRKDRSLFLV